jgi:hypothetical protein
VVSRRRRLVLLANSSRPADMGTGNQGVRESKESK